MRERKCTFESDNVFDREREEERVCLCERECVFEREKGRVRMREGRECERACV